MAKSHLRQAQCPACLLLCTDQNLDIIIGNYYITKVEAAEPKREPNINFPECYHGICCNLSLAHHKAYRSHFAEKVPWRITGRIL